MILLPCLPTETLDGHHNRSPLCRNSCRTYWTQLLRTGSQPFRHSFWGSGVEDLEAEPAPAPGSLAAPKRFRLGTEPTRSEWPRMPRAALASPGRLRLAPSSGGPVRPAPAGSPTPQASAPPAASAFALDRPGASREATGPARLTARRPLTHPQPQPPRPAHNIRPAFRLRHPSRAKPRARSRAAPPAAHAHMHRPQQALGTRKHSPDSHPPTEVFTSVSPDGPTVSEPRLP